MATDRPIWNYLLPLIVLVVVGVLWFSDTSGGLFPTAKEKFNVMVDLFVPEITVGERALKAGRTTLEGSTLESADSLKKTLEALASAKTGTNCFAKYNPFTTDMGDDVGSASILFNYDESHDLTHVVIYKRKEVVSSEFDVKGMKPCVIAGYDGGSYVARNFYEGYLKKDISSAQKPYLFPLDTMQIGYSQDYRNGNRLSILQLLRGGTPDPEVVNDRSRNFEDGGLLFKGPDNELCFFTTNRWRDADEDGLNNDIVAELGRKFDSGDPATPSCLVSEGYQAVTISANMDASSEEMDCIDSARGEILQSDTRRVFVSMVHSFLKGLEGGCSAFSPQQVPPSGCVAFVNSAQRTAWRGHACGMTIVRSGEVIPSQVAEEGLTPYTNPPVFDETAVACAVQYGEWFSRDEKSLLCSGNMWKECGPSIVGTTQEVKVESSGVQKTVTYTCSKSNTGTYYDWIRKGDLDFQLYRGFEIYGLDSSGELMIPFPSEYPLSCNPTSGTIVGLCDFSGKMGVSGKGKAPSGLYPCPSQDVDCDDVVSESDVTDGNSPEFPYLDKLSSKGCQVFMSGDAGTSENDCGRAVVPFGTLVGAGFTGGTSFYGCSGEETCAPGPVEVSLSSKPYEKWVGCLLQYSWSLPPAVRGDLLCAPGASTQGAWHLCDARVVDRCVSVSLWDSSSHQFCCKFNKEEKIYQFIDTPNIR